MSFLDTFIAILELFFMYVKLFYELFGLIMTDYTFLHALDVYRSWKLDFEVFEALTTP